MTLHDFAGMLLFDKWTCNTNGQQTVFFETTGRPASPVCSHDEVLLIAVEP